MITGVCAQTSLTARTLCPHISFGTVGTEEPARSALLIRTSVWTRGSLSVTVEA